jgi:ABC-type transporter Mla MlaB component
MASWPPSSVTLTITGPLDLAGLPALFERTSALLAGSGAEVLRCEVAGAVADAVVVDALARLALAARKARPPARVLVCGASPELLRPIDLMGLADVLRSA